MRKIILSFFIFIFLLTTPAAFAQTGSPSASKATPTATSNIAFTKSLAVLLTRFEAAFTRLDKIAQRIDSRLSKLNSADLQQKTLTEKLTKSKTDLAALNAQSQALGTNTSTRQDYILFKNKVMVLTKNLKDVYKLELDLVANIKKQAVATATPTAVVIPTK